MPPGRRRCDGRHDEGAAGKTAGEDLTKPTVERSRDVAMGAEARGAGWDGTVGERPQIAEGRTALRAARPRDAVERAAHLASRALHVPLVFVAAGPNEWLEAFVVGERARRG